MNQSLTEVFASARAARRALFLPYICVGYPAYAASLECAKAALRAGAAALELGVPFSDPIADGPTLQKATFLSLQGGTKFVDVFRLIKDLRREGFQQPLLVMTYLNPIEQMGWKQFSDQVAQSGGSGAIVPDLPLEQFKGPGSVLARAGLALIPFVAPTSDSDRIKMADAQGAPFLYYVSVTGVTGERNTLSPGLLGSLRALKRKLKTPLVVGFGISTAEQAAQVGKTADGVIIASALVKIIAKTKIPEIGKAVEAFCGQVVKALK